MTKAASGGRVCDGRERDSRPGGSNIYEKLFSGQLNFEFTLNGINSDIKKLSFILIRHDTSVIMLLKLLFDI